MGDGWKTDIAKELNAAGYHIDFNKIFEQILFVLFVDFRIITDKRMGKDERKR